MKNKQMNLYDRLILCKRIVMESVNDFLKNICDIEHSRHRSIANFLVNLFSALVAYSFLPKNLLSVLLLICQRALYALLTDFFVKLMCIYSTVLLKDIVIPKKIPDVQILKNIVKFLFNNIGSMVSSKKIADNLTSFGRKTTSVTARNYVSAFLESFILYKAVRYDVQGKQHLKSMEKYYEEIKIINIVDFLLEEYD